MSKTDASAVLDNGIGSDGLRPLINSAIQDIKMKRHRRMRDSMKKGIYLFPNLLTTGNLFSGFLAIVYVFDKNYLHAAIAILVAGFFDLLDGRLARFSKTTSRFGIE
jgi:CDP-diacylglycerol--serine O-phosphatidyltransferase